MQPVKLFERAAGTAAHALRHPIASAAYAAGLARGLAGAARHGATDTGREPEHGPTPAAPHMPTQRRASVSRQSAHGGPATDAEIDAWIDEAMARGRDVDVETPVGTTGADVGHNPDTAEADLQQPGTEPIDTSTTKAVKSESEMLRKDAERDPAD
jgi:hypothetical protein